MWGVRHRGGRLQQVTGQLHLTNTQKVCPPRRVPLCYSKPASPAGPCLYPEHKPHPSSHYLDPPLNPEPLFSGAQPAHKVNMMSLPHQTNTSPTMTEGSLQAGAPLSVENCVCPTAAMALLALTPTQFCCFCWWSPKSCWPLCCRRVPRHCLHVCTVRFRCGGLAVQLVVGVSFLLWFACPFVVGCLVVVTTFCRRLVAPLALGSVGTSPPAGGLPVARVSKAY